MFDGTYVDIHERGCRSVRKRRNLIMDIFRSFGQWCRACDARSRQRRALRELDGRLLRDIGVSPEQRARECGKPFWL